MPPVDPQLGCQLGASTRQRYLRLPKGIVSYFHVTPADPCPPPGPEGLEHRLLAGEPGRVTLGPHAAAGFGVGLLALGETPTREPLPVLPEHRRDPLNLHKVDAVSDNVNRITCTHPTHGIG